MAKTRMLFIALAPPGTTPTAMTQNMPVNQTLGSVMEFMLTIPGAYDADWGALDDYVLQDLYKQDLDPGILVSQVPFPGCVIAVSRRSAVEFNGDTLTGDRAVAAVTQWIANILYAQRNDQDDPISRRYARYLQSWAWQFEPTPITRMDVGLTYHEADSEAGIRLVDLLTAQGLQCSVRVASQDGSCTMDENSSSPAEDGRALVILISEATRNDPWMAYDIGAAWALGIPVVPVLIGTWDTEPPNILAPYQRLYWDDNQEGVLEELTSLLGPAPESLKDLLKGSGDAPSE